MRKKMIISSILLAGSLLVAGQAIGQSERTEVFSATPQTDTQREDTAGDPRPGFSGADQQRARERGQQFNSQRSPQQQGQVQQDFGVSPRFEDRDDIQSRQQTQNRSDDQPGESDLTRDQGSSALPGLGQGQRDGTGQSGSGSSGGFGGQGGQGGSGGR